MTENTPAPLANFDAGAVAALTPEGRAAFSVSMLRAGYDAAAIDRVLSGVPSAPATAAVDDRGQQINFTAAPQPQRESLDAAKHPTLTDQQRKALADNLRQFWTGDPAALEDALRANGYREPEQVANQQSEWEQTFDKYLGGAKPADYHLDGIYQGLVEPDATGKVDVSVVAALDAKMRGALAAMQIPGVLGRAFAEEFLNAVGEYPGLQNDAAKALYTAEQKIIVTRMFPGKSYEDVVALARIVASQIPADTAQMFAEQGVFEKASVMIQLARQGERLQARKAAAVK